jgi:tetratricopeptide (TPR) repeat protein
MDDLQNKRQTWLVCLGLALAILAAYSPLWHAGFVSFDDNDYVTSNDMVQHGLSWAGVVWAFSTFQASIWHPLTWISYQVDSQIYGMNPAGYHLTNVLLHMANSILLFLLLRRMTGVLWRSALVAALFALHPMHVESVAWIAERKDVLSTLFWMLAVWAYVRYAEEFAVKSPKAKTFYIGSVVLFALGLMAKPMLVTLPLILLLLDFWPMRRGRTPIARLLAEKTPFFILAVASCAVTLLVAHQVGAVKSLAAVSLRARLENIPVSYARYIAKTFWPSDLAVLYPYEFHWPVWEIAGASALLGLITGWVVWRVRSQPNYAAGWFWFLVMLAPVIGLIQAGPFSMADRYAYLSNAGLLIMVIWTGRIKARVFIVGGGLVLTGCLVATSIQVRYWHDSEALFRHTLAVTKNNSVIESDLGHVLCQKGRANEALPHVLKAVALNPNLALAHYNLGNVLLAQGRNAEALAQFEIHVNLDPLDPVAQYNFGSVLLDQGLAEDAIPHLEKAVQIRPGAADYHDTLGNAFRRTGRAAEAISQYEKSLQIVPRYAEASSSLAWMLATTPKASLRNGSRAVQLALLANQLSGGPDPKILGILAAAYAEAGDFSKAAATGQRALQLAGPENQSALAGTLREQLALYRAGSPFRDNEK